MSLGLHFVWGAVLYKEVKHNAQSLVVCGRSVPWYVHICPPTHIPIHRKLAFVWIFNLQHSCFVLETSLKLITEHRLALKSWQSSCLGLWSTKTCLTTLSLRLQTLHQQYFPAARPSMSLSAVQTLRSSDLTISVKQIQLLILFCRLKNRTTAHLGKQ